jgi:cell wall-associated NlpC family hydrolase
MMEKLLIVDAPVADIRRKPVDAKPQYVHDDLQETQVLYNELLRYRDETEEWYYVEAVEQLRIVGEGVSQGYSGWIRKRSVSPIDSPPKYNGVVREKAALIAKEPSEKGKSPVTVSIGTRLMIGESNHATHYQIITRDGKDGWVKKRDVNMLGCRPVESALRKSIIGAAKLFLGVPYLWGGRSMHMPELVDERVEPPLRRDKGRAPPSSGQGQGSSFVGTRAEGEVTLLNTQRSALLNSQLSAPKSVLTGVDCSGLTNLVFRVNDIDIPRDAHDQWLAAEKISHDRLKPGDLIFVSEQGKSGCIAHVLLNAGEGVFFEAEETGSVVSLTDFSDKFGMDLDHLAGQGFRINDRQISFGRMIPPDEPH